MVRSGCSMSQANLASLAMIDDVAANPRSLVGAVRKRVNKPHNTVDRELAALYMLGVFECEDAEEFSYLRRHSWRRLTTTGSQCWTVSVSVARHHALVTHW